VRSGLIEIRDTVLAVAVAVVLALLVRHFVVETYRVNGESMQPTLQNGERLLVNKFVFRFSPPRVGEIIVFHPPLPTSEDYVKRIVAVGGETVSMQNGEVYIDGRLQSEPYLPAAYRDHYTMAPLTVPPGDVFVLGDHRAASEDSRFFPGHFVPVGSIHGEAVLIWWPPADFRALGAG